MYEQPNHDVPTVLLAFSCVSSAFMLRSLRLNYAHDVFSSASTIIVISSGTRIVNTSRWDCEHIAVLERQCHVTIQQHGSFGRSLDIACHGMVFPKEEPDDRCNYDFDEDGSTTPSQCDQGNVPLSHSRTRRYEKWTNDNDCRHY